MHMHTTMRSFVESADIRQKGKSNHALEFLIIPPAPAQASKEVGFEIFCQPPLPEEWIQIMKSTSSEKTINFKNVTIFRR